MDYMQKNGPSCKLQTYILMSASHFTLQLQIPANALHLISLEKKAPTLWEQK